jgi:class 3 adenylate cyclase
LAEVNETPPIDYSKPQSYTPKHLADKILTSRSSIEGERKLVTIMFADISGFTALAQYRGQDTKEEQIDQPNDESPPWFFLENLPGSFGSLRN